MYRVIRNFGITFFAASVMVFSPANAVVSTDIGMDDPSLFGLFCGCDFCGGFCERDICDDC